jgi:hypothetical protein
VTPIPGPTAKEQVAFLGKVERILSEGQFVGTYKFALLLAIADLAVKLGSDDGSELDLPIRAIAEEFIELYWRQAPAALDSLNALRRSVLPVLMLHRSPRVMAKSPRARITRPQNPLQCAQTGRLP